MWQTTMTGTYAGQPLNIGMTDEHDIGFYLKCVRVAEMTFGDAPFHRHRFAALAGYRPARLRVLRVCLRR